MDYGKHPIEHACKCKPWQRCISLPSVTTLMRCMSLPCMVILSFCNNDACNTPGHTYIATVYMLLLLPALVTILILVGVEYALLSTSHYISIQSMAAVFVLALCGHTNNEKQWWMQYAIPYTYTQYGCFYATATPSDHTDFSEQVACSMHQDLHPIDWMDI